MLSANTGANLAHAAVYALKAGRDRAEQGHASGSHFHASGVPIEETGANLFFQRLNLPRYGALRERHFLGGSAEIQVACNGFKGAQVARADGASAQMGLGMQHVNHLFMRLMNE